MKTARGVAAVLSATACAAFGADAPVTYGPPVIVTATRFEETLSERPVPVESDSRSGKELSLLLPGQPCLLSAQ